MNNLSSELSNELFSGFQDPRLIEIFSRRVEHWHESDKIICQEIRKDLLSLVAPYRGIEKIIVGRERETNWLKNVLDYEKGSINLIEGEIGSGKTLLLNLLRELALERNYVVTKIEVSKVRTIGSATKLYSYIINNISIPEKPALIGRLELVFKKVFFRLYDSTCRELSNWSQQSTDPRTQRRIEFIMKYKIHEFIMRKIGEFISEVEQIDSKIAGDIAKDMKTVFDADIMGYDLSLRDFRLHEERGRTTDSVYAFNQLIKYAGYRGLLILVDELEQDRSLDTYNTIYSLSNNYTNTGLKVAIAGTNDLIEDPTSGVRRLKRELWELLEKSRISINPLTFEDQKELCTKIMNVLRIAGTIRDIDDISITSKIDDFFNKKEFKRGFTVRDLIKNFIMFIEKEWKNEI
ncbi:MAG: BREX system ATP-binding domain-containing protein [Halobacteriota archaeon]